MRPETKLKKLKYKIIDKIRESDDCTISFRKEPGSYVITAIFNTEYSEIEFKRDDLTQVYIRATLKDLDYYAYIDMPLARVAKMYLIDARKAKTCEDYSSIIEELILDYAEDYIEYEHIVETLFKRERSGLYQFEYDLLRRAIFYNGNVAFNYEYRRGYDIMEHEIHIFKDSMMIFFDVTKNDEKVEDGSILMMDVPKAFDSIVSYALNISSLDEYLKFEKAIRELMRLVNVEKRDIKEVIKELVEKYGYWDVFGYRI